MFVVIEGIDGSGKGTQLCALKSHFESLGKKVMTLDFPRYEQESSFFVKKYLNGGYGDCVDAQISSMFYALDRFDALFDFGEISKEYDIILSNRYVYSSMIHQGAKILDTKKREELFDWIDTLEFHTLRLPRPDKVFFLDVPPDISDKLVEKKEQRAYIEGDENKDLHEKDADHMKHAYQSAKQLTQLYDNWEAIACLDETGELKTIEEITDLMLQHIHV